MPLLLALIVAGAVLMLIDALGRDFRLAGYGSAVLGLAAFGLALAFFLCKATHDSNELVSEDVLILGASSFGAGLITAGGVALLKVRK